MHVCLPQGKGLPQGRPQENSSCEHGIVFLSSCPPWQRLVVSTTQGGQSPVWQVCSGSWPQGRGRRQGAEQAGGRAPQCIGGSVTCAPHEHRNSSKLRRGQGAQWPVWQNSSQRCSWQLSERPHTTLQRCDAAAQHAVRQRCRPHDSFLLHFFWHNTLLYISGKSAQGTSRLEWPQRH